MLKTGCPPLNVPFKFADLTTLTASRILLIGCPLSPTFAIIITLIRRPFSSPFFIALFHRPISHAPLIRRPLVQELCRQTVTSMPSANQLPVAAIVTPGKI
jgi:hypothetical protein